jgi:hypothetical protein
MIKGKASRSLLLALMRASKHSSHGLLRSVPIGYVHNTVLPTDKSRFLLTSFKRNKSDEEEDEGHTTASVMGLLALPKKPNESSEAFS